MPEAVQTASIVEVIWQYEDPSLHHLRSLEPQAAAFVAYSSVPQPDPQLPARQPSFLLGLAGSNNVDCLMDPEDRDGKHEPIGLTGPRTQTSRLWD